MWDQTISCVDAFFANKNFDPFVASGAIGMLIDDVNGDNFDHSGLGFVGAVLNQWLAQNLTGDTHTGIGGWSVAQIALYLQFGHNEFTAATGAMAEVVADSTSQMTDADRQTIAIYLKDQPSQPAPYSPTADAAVLWLGAAVYDQQCAAFHTGQGIGTDGLASAFAHAPSIQAYKSDQFGARRAARRGLGCH
jgi:mono/diheme cytochrome c family protein